MSNTELDERIRKRCKALAKDILKTGGITDLDETLVASLVMKAFDRADPVSKCRQAYEFYLANKVHGDLAWTMSGMSKLVGHMDGTDRA